MWLRKERDRSVCSSQKEAEFVRPLRRCSRCQFVLPSFGRNLDWVAVQLQVGTVSSFGCRWVVSTACQNSTPQKNGFSARVVVFAGGTSFPFARYQLMFSLREPATALRKGENIDAWHV